MSVSKTVAILRAKEEANVAAAQAQLNLVDQVLAAIPGNSPAPISVSRHGYCAQASLTFQGVGPIRTLLELYPPMDCVDVRGHDQSQKPQKYLRDQDSYSAITPIFPVTFKSSSKQQEARWWTTMNGLDVEIHVLDSCAGELEDELTAKYCAQSHNFSSGSVCFFARRLSSPKVRPSAMVAWIDVWNDFAVDLNLGPVQRKFLQKVADLLVAKKFPDSEELTVEYLKTLFVPGFGSSNLDGLFKLHEQDAVLAFARSKVPEAPAVAEQQARDVQSVHTWFESFFARFSHLYENDTTSANYIRHQLCHDTGLDIKVRIMRQTGRRVGVSFWFEGHEFYPDGSYPLSSDPMAPRVKPQEIVVEYL